MIFGLIFFFIALAGVIYVIVLEARPSVPQAGSLSVEASEITAEVTRAIAGSYWNEFAREASRLSEYGGSYRVGARRSAANQQPKYIVVGSSIEPRRSAPHRLVGDYVSTDVLTQRKLN